MIFKANVVPPLVKRGPPLIKVGLSAQVTDDGRRDSEMVVAIVGHGEMRKSEY